MMTSGNFLGGGAGMGLSSVLLEAAAGGGGYGDMLGARQVQMGVGANDRFMSGGIDPLQKALNASAALSVAGNSPYSTKHALMGLDTASQLDIIRTGKVSKTLASMGVDARLVQKYTAEQDRMAFARVSDSMLTGTQRSQLAQYRKHGGLWKGADLETLSGVLSLGTGDSPEAALGRLRIQAARGRLGDLAGRGAGRSSSAKALSRIAMGEQGGVGADQARFEGENLGTLTGGVKGARGVAGGLDAAGNSAQRAAAGGDLGAAVSTIAADLQHFVSLLQGVAHGVAPGVKAGAPR
jgi:hypothetical protein